jgi:hypothetical protein
MSLIFEKFQRYASFFIFGGLIISAACGIYLIIHASHYGPWAFSDATAYVWTAHNLAEGRGLVIQNPAGGYDLLTWHPPLFPILLSIPVALGADALQAIRWINALSFGITIFISGFATWRYTRSMIATFGVTALTVFAIDLIFVFSGAMSEAIFFVLGFGSLFLLVEALQSNIKLSLLFFAGVLAGLSYLARYAGIVFVGTVLIIPLLFIPGSIGKRFRVMLTAGLPAIIIPIGWTIFVFLNNQTIGGRSVLPMDSFRLDFTNYTQKFWDVITGWIPFILRGNHILPAEWKFVLGVVIVLCVLSFGIMTLLKKFVKSESHIHLIWLTAIGVFFFAYLSFHFFSYIFSSAAPAIDRRLLSPLLLSGILLMGAIFSLPLVSSTKKFQPPRYIFLFYVIISLFYFQGQLRSFLYDHHHFGIGYNSKRWQESQLVQQAVSLDPRIPQSSNDPALVLFHSGRFPHSFDLFKIINEGIENTKENMYIILFSQQAINQYGDEAGNYLEKFKQNCNVMFEDNEGFICYWERK